MADRRKPGPHLRMLRFLLAAGVFLALKLALHWGLFMAALAGFASWLVLGFVVRGLVREKESIVIPADSGLTVSEVKRVIRESSDKVREIRGYTIKIRNNDVAAKVQEICRAAMDIIDSFQKDPADIKRSRQFINYYLDSTRKIVGKYVELADSRTMTPEIEAAMRRVEEVLGSILDSFKKQKSSLLENDLLDLDVEVSVLEKTIKMEG